MRLMLVLPLSIFPAFAHAQSLPAAIAAPGETAVATWHAEGAQVYECKAGADGKLAWARGLAHRAKLDNNAALAKFSLTLEKVCVDTVESGFMTKDLALLVGPDQKWLSTTGFLDKVDESLKKAMAA